MLYVADAVGATISEPSVPAQAVNSDRTILATLVATAETNVVAAGAIVQAEKNSVNSKVDGGSVDSGGSDISESSDDGSSSSGDDAGKNSTSALHQHQHQQPQPSRQRISAVKVTPPSADKASVKSTKIEMPAGLNYVFDSHPANKHHHHDYR